MASIEQEAMRIDGFIKKSIDENNNLEERREAIKNLLSCCHPRWLGDYYVEGITYKEWTDLISIFYRSLCQYNKAKLKG